MKFIPSDPSLWQILVTEIADHTIGGTLFVTTAVILTVVITFIFTEKF